MVEAMLALPTNSITLEGEGVVVAISAAQRGRAPNQKAGLRKLPLRDYLTDHDSPARERALDG